MFFHSVIFAEIVNKKKVIEVCVKYVQMENLTKASHKLAEIMYQQAQTQAPDGTVDPAAAAAADGSNPGPESTEEAKADGDVIDAEFEESKE